MEKKFIEYSKNTGLKIHSKAQIMDDLLSICKSSYGNDYNVEQGTEMYAFLDNLAYALAELNGAVKAVYDDFGFTTATGVPLDVLCSLAGISRNAGETDTQLRARYFKYLYSKSVSTVKSLETKLLDLRVDIPDSSVPNSSVTAYIDSVKILNNDTNTDKNINGVSVPSKSIAVICKIDDAIQNTPTIDKHSFYDSIDDTILEYKSLGCGVVTQTIEGQTFSFMVAEPADIREITINLKILNNQLDANQQSAIKELATQKISEYLSSISLGEDILYSGFIKAIYDTQKELSYTESLFTDVVITVFSSDTDPQGANLNINQDFKLSANEFVPTSTMETVVNLVEVEQEE